GEVAKHVYHEGISSERTRGAFKLVTRSRALREAVERGDPAAVRAAAQALIATGRITNLRVLRGASGGEGASEILADAGGAAVTPLRGTITGASGAPIARFVTSVWADSGVVAETNGIAESSTVLRAGPHTIAGSRAQTQVRRVQRDPALLRGVVARDPEATRLAINNLLTEHIVRLRVSVDGRLLRDVGGPYVLAPVSGVLHAGPRTIGTFVLS